MQKILKNILSIAIIFSIVVGFTAAAENGFFISTLFPTQHSKLQKWADEVIAVCKQKSYPPSCYDEEIPKVMDHGLTMEEGFEVTRLVQAQNPNYFYCHVLGHHLSEKETAKDPSNWASVIARCPIGMCSNGCLHGAFQERFRDDVMSDKQIQALLPQISQICEKNTGRNFTGLEQASCYHALGHLSMYITGANLQISTNVCDKVAVKPDQHENYTQTCYEGVYMQMFQPLEPEDFALVKKIAPKTTTQAETLCDTFTGERQAACHRESWPLYKDSIKTAPGLKHFCDLVPDPKEIQRCFNAMFYVLTAQFNFDESRIVPLCEALPEKRKAQCFANAASRFIETDYRLIPRAVDLCKAAAANGVGDRCYGELLFYSTFNFHKGSTEFNQLCNALPEPWTSACLNGDGANMQPSKNDI